jgi:hypothetical protein
LQTKGHGASDRQRQCHVVLALKRPASIFS